ncbi:MAG: hypothetical protein HUJ77_12350 [Clostridium sp.]|uniref:hypothetical protein n=1 Tax=Clostridium sp. TaxID=1506 RepID=UPI0025BB3D4C|nr:hypothetical protein [Clostridium sp.]MCF0149173.1 hypothetical protein [Clostridium sp.]
MKSFRISKNASVLLIIFVLFVSLLINVYTSIMNSRYKIIIGKETYKCIEEIRSRNESSLAILDQCLKAKSVSNEELLSLYKNYSSISKEYTALWISYKEYGKEEIISINRKSKIPNKIPTEVYSRVESLLFEQLNYEMRTNNEKVILVGDALDNFTEIYNLTSELNSFYKDFNETKLKDVDIDDREITYIKKSYWIDILDGMNTVIEPYSDYEFTFKE